MPKNGKEYKLAIRIAGVVDKNYDLALARASNGLKSFEKSMEKIDGTFRTLDRGFDGAMRVGKKCFDVIAKAAMAAAAAIGTITVAATKIGSDFEAEMSVVQAISQATDKDLDRLAKKAREVGKVSVFSATEVGEAMEFMGMAGWKTEEMLAGIEGVVNLAAASGEEMSTVSSIVVDTLTAMGRTADDTSEFVDVLAQAAMNSNTNVELMGQTFKYAAPIAGALGYNFKDLAIATGLMASNGIKGSLAGTALRNLLTRMAKPTKESKEAMDALGLSLTDSEGNMLSLMDILQRLRDNFAKNGDSEEMQVALTTLGGLSDEQMEDVRSGLGDLTEAEEAFYAAELGGLRGMSGLLAIANSSDETFDKLTEAIYGSEGAVKQMAGVRLNNLQGDITIMKDALRDAGIELYYQFNDDLREGVQWVTEVINDAAKYVPAFFRKVKEELPAIWRTFKKYAAPIFNILYDFGKWVFKNGKLIISFIAGIGAALIAYKVVSTLVHIVTFVAKIISLGSVLGPVVVSLMALIAAVGALAGAFVNYKLTESELIDQDLENHFGSIALSMDEIADIADYIVQTKNLDQVKETLEAFKDLDPFTSDIEQAIKTMDRLKWKISIGMELTDKEKEDYEEAVQTYISTLPEYLTQEQYALNLNLWTLFDENDPTGHSIVNKINSFFEANKGELESLGEDLAQAVKQGFEEGFEFDLATVQKIQEQMAEVERQLGINEYDTALVMLGGEFSGKQLTPESFMDLQSQLGDATANVARTYRETYAKSQVAYDKMFNSGELTPEEYKDLSSRNKMLMESGIAESNLKALEFMINTVYGTYGEDIDKYKQIRDDAIRRANETDWTNLDEEAFGIAFNEILNRVANSPFLDSTKRDAISKLIDGMMPSLSELQYIEKWIGSLTEDDIRNLPKSIQESIASSKEKLPNIIDLIGPLMGAGGSTQGWFSRSEYWEEFKKDVVKSTIGGDNTEFSTWLLNNYGNLVTLTPQEQEQFKGIAKENVEARLSDVQSAIDEILNNYTFTGSAELDIVLSPEVTLDPKRGTLNVNGLTITDILGVPYSFNDPLWKAYMEASQEASDTQQGVEKNYVKKGNQIVLATDGTLSGDAFDYFKSIGSGARAEDPLGIKFRAKGGFVNGLQLSWLGEKGPEAVIPLDGSRNAMSLWQKTGQLLGMGSLIGRYDLSGSSSSASITYSPTLQFYGEAPSRADLDDALRMSQDEFEAMMEQYLKNNGRLAFR